MEKSNSLLQKERIRYQPALPEVLEALPAVLFKEGFGKEGECEALFPQLAKKPVLCLEKGKEQKAQTPLTVGVFFSGGQAPGGHNVIWGLFEGLKKFHKGSRLLGFLGGPSGLLDKKYQEITAESLTPFLNSGGFDLIGSGRTKIESEAQLEMALKVVQELKLSGLVIIGGDDSNTNAAHLAEFFLSHKSETKVIGVPKTIDGDLRNEAIEISFGFDTACKVYAELIGNIARDALSAKKYYHFIKLMGRSASHVALECALQVHPNFVLIGEEVLDQKRRLKEIAEELASLIVERSFEGKNYGVVLIPEGLIEFIPEIKQLIKELNAALASDEGETALAKLSKEARETFDSMPEKIQKQLLLDRDPHGNVQVSLIATEELLIEMVKRELKKREEYKGKFSAVPHFLGYEGRASFPSNFDANYTFSLGLVASSLIAQGKTGYMATVSQLTKPVREWKGGGTPLVAMMQMEQRKGKEVAVIAKKLVDLKGAPFNVFTKGRKQWRLEDNYQFPGPIQFFGPAVLTDVITETLRYEKQLI